MLFGDVDVNEMARAVRHVAREYPKDFAPSASTFGAVLREFKERRRHKPERVVPTGRRLPESTGEPNISAELRKKIDQLMRM